MRWMLLLFVAGCQGEEPGETDRPDPEGQTIAVKGASCDLDDTIGEVQILVEGGVPQFGAVVYNKADPWLGPAALSNDYCDHHTFNPGVCGACDEGMVCGFEGECVPERRTLQDASVQLTADGTPEVFEAVEQGYMWGQVGTVDSVFSAALRFQGHEAILRDTRLIAGALDVKVSSAGDYDKPGDLDVSWTPTDGGTVLGTVIPINHHASGPTFTSCHADTKVGGFRADAAMVDPLAVSTGLEFQGVTHYVVAAANTPHGCVEFRVGTRQHVDVTWE